MSVTWGSSWELHFTLHFEKFSSQICKYYSLSFIVLSSYFPINETMIGVYVYNFEISESIITSASHSHHTAINGG